MDITRYIPTGKKNAISTKDLMKATKRTQREIGRLVRNARCNGDVILSDSKGGYWLPDYSEADIDKQLTAFIRYMDSKNTYSAVSSAKAALKRVNSAAQVRINEV